MKVFQILATHLIATSMVFAAPMENAGSELEVRADDILTTIDFFADADFVGLIDTQTVPLNQCKNVPNKAQDVSDSVKWSNNQQGVKVNCEFFRNSGCSGASQSGDRPTAPPGVNGCVGGICPPVQSIGEFRFLLLKKMRSVRCKVV